MSSFVINMNLGQPTCFRQHSWLKLKEVSSFSVMRLGNFFAELNFYETLIKLCRKPRGNLGEGISSLR